MLIEYDESDRKVSITHYRKGEPSYKESYDQQGNINERTWIDPNKITKQVITYDNDNRIIKDVTYENGNLKNETTFTYGKNGSSTEKSAGTNPYKRIKKLDRNGSLVKETFYDKENKVTSLLSYTYKNGALQTNSYDGAYGQGAHHYTYNDRGLMIERKDEVKGPVAKIVRWEYEYY